MTFENSPLRLFDPVVMFKILVLQALYSLLDEATKFQVKDRLSFQRFLGLGLDGKVPDATVVPPPQAAQHRRGEGGDHAEQDP